MSCKRDTQREAIVAGSTKAVGDLWSVSSLPELQVQHLPLAHRDKPSPEAHLRASLSDSSHSPLPGSCFSSRLYAPLHEHCNPYNLAPASLREYTPLQMEMAVTTVSGFSGPPTASQTFGTLRLSENGRHQRRRRKGSPSPAPQDEQRTPESDTSTLKPDERCFARVTGFDEYATKAIRTANGVGQDELVLSWAGCDSVVRPSSSCSQDPQWRHTPPCC